MILMKRGANALWSAVVVVTGVLGAGHARAQDNVIKVDGSSTVFPITEAVAEEFQKVNKGIKVTVGESGTGGGMKKFQRGEIDICDASRPIKAAEMEECKKAGIQFIELPIAFDALTVVVNPANTTVKQLTIADLKKIWEPAAQGKITKWNQVNPAWPDTDLKLYGPGTASGTFEYFTEVVNGKSKESRTDFTPSEDDNVLVQGVANDKGGMGYFGFSYYTENQSKLRAVPIVNPATGKAVMPSIEAVKDGSYAPFARPLFIYVNKKSLDRPEVKRFVEFYLAQGSTLVPEADSVALPTDAYTSGAERLRKMQTGTGFGGGGVGAVKAEELYTRPLINDPPAAGEKKDEKK